MSRVINCIDLVAVEARYHRKCYADFFRASSSKSDMTVGWPTDSSKESWFRALCQWLDGLLVDLLKSRNHDVQCSDGDADTLIVRERN